MKLSNAGIKLIKDFEQFRSKAYKDMKGVWTIGYGTTDPRYAFEGNEIDEDMAISLMQEDVRYAENMVNNLVEVPLNQNQFDALVSLVYNIGVGAFRSSTLLRKLNKGDYDGAAEQFEVWTRSGKQRNVKGLIRRRRAERALFEAEASPAEETNVQADKESDPRPKLALAGGGSAVAVERVFDRFESLAPYSDVALAVLLIGTMVYLLWGTKLFKR